MNELVGLISFGESQRERVPKNHDSAHKVRRKIINGGHPSPIITKCLLSVLLKLVLEEANNIALNPLM